MSIGLKGNGYDIELEVKKETQKACLVEDDEGNEMWIPKSAFTEWGELNEWGVRLYEDKV